MLAIVQGLLGERSQQVGVRMDPRLRSSLQVPLHDFGKLLHYYSFAAKGALSSLPFAYPGLAPWATFLRRSAAVQADFAVIQRA